MTNHRHGLVIGKFYPPTPGHEYLIRRALELCERVTVLVEWSRFETIPGYLRARWIEEMIGSPRLQVRSPSCEVVVDFDDPVVSRAQAAVVQEVLRGMTPRPDALVVSERYGADLARRLGVALCEVDPHRETVPISATQVRADLYAHWSQLAPAVRAGLATRVAVVGSESTGTTTLAEDLAAHYRGLVPDLPTLCVPEYGREYTELLVEKQRRRARGGVRSAKWTPKDFRLIAERQNEMEEEGARAGGPLLVCDTDSLATGVWQQRYLGSRPGHSGTGVPRKHLYLVTDHEGVPFVQDGWRDGEAVRARMTGWFIKELAEVQFPWMLVSGTREQRLSLAVRLIDRILERNRTFTAPLG